MASTPAQQIAVAIAPKFTATLSIFGSGALCYLGYLNLRNSSGGNKRTPPTYHRLLIGMSACDLSASTAWFFTTWPIPRGTPGVFGALGTQQTCTAQAFFAQFSLSAVMYNAALAVYYFLVIVREWSGADILRIEPCFHLHAIAWGLGTAVASLALTLFNQVGWDCWISASPLGCKESWKNNGITTCTRGDNGSLYQWAFYYAPLWAVLILVTSLMYSVYWTVKQQEKKMRQYRLGADVTTATNECNRSRKIANQAMWYVGAFYASWIFPTIFQLVLVTNGNIYFPLLFLTAFSVPIQGFLNLLVYTHPKYLRYRSDYPNSLFILAWGRMLWTELSGDTTSLRGSASTSERRSHRLNSTVTQKDQRGSNVALSLGQNNSTV